MGGMVVYEERDICFFGLLFNFSNQNNVLYKIDKK